MSMCVLSSYRTILHVRACVGIRSNMALYSPALLALCTVGYVHIRPSTSTSFSHYRCHQLTRINSDVFFDVLIDRFRSMGWSTPAPAIPGNLQRDLRQFWAWMERCTQLGSMKNPLIKSISITNILPAELGWIVGTSIQCSVNLRSLRVDISKFQPQILTVSHEKLGLYCVCFDFVLDTKTSCLTLYF